MEAIIEQNIKQKIDSLVDFVLKKNPNANRDYIYHKISKLNLYGSVVQAKVQSSKNKVLKHQKVLETCSLKNITIKVQRSHFSNFILAVDQNNPKFNDLIENKFVMNVGSKMVIGVENSDGEVEPLNKILIEICMKYKLRYEIPLNLNTSDDMDRDILIDNEINELGLNHAESDEDDDEDDDE